MKTIKDKIYRHSFLLQWRGLGIGFFFFVFLFYTEITKAQDMHFTQFYSAPLFLNPAFTGSHGCSRFSATYRNQWPGISKTYRSFLCSADHFLHDKSLGVGIMFGSDIAGTGDLKTTLINPSIAYEARLGRNMALRFGAQPGITIKSINFNNLIFGDQLARGGNVNTIEKPAQSRLFIDIGAGVLAYTKKYWAGASAYHLNRPNESLMGAKVVKLPIKYSVHGGAKFSLDNSAENEDIKKEYITTAFNYRGQSQFDQLDIGFYYSRNVFNAGIWYRGIPGFKAYKPGYENNDEIAIIIGIRNNKMDIGYSYDITISKLYKISNGAHEITISYQICKPPKKKKYGLILPCPKF